ncbi:YdbL family protein [Termitidicoccus mucosus]|uniref:DUF1318 domain-containing protein n=1 Tax=Termitidicoccus mucosus TaxID=1184151 RepID=A0A178IQH4_9BACT|nr:hypothetical protein AW736_01470 [Opitutaceae bacterium TSB47]
MKPMHFLRLAATAFVFLFAAALAAPSAHAQDLGAIKSKMAARLPQIDKLKEQGALGENNRGLLEVRENKNNAAAIASEENADRQTVYAAIAKQQKTTAEEVGKARARQIAQSSKPGVWIQDEKGNWRKK